MEGGGEKETKARSKERNYLSVHVPLAYLHTQQRCGPSSEFFHSPQNNVMT